jgi:hypothetical protein
LPPQNERNRNQRSNDAGQRQRGAAGGGTNKPWGHGKAVIRLSEEKSIFVAVGAIWETENGNLQLVLECEPNQWKDPHCRRVVVLLKSEERTSRQ